MRNYSLTLKTPVLDVINGVSTTQGMVADLTDAASDWRRSRLDVGGFWDGTFTLGDGAIDIRQAFDTWLGCHIEERIAGKVVWEGMIFDMDLTVAGVTRNRNYLDMINAVMASYLTQDYSGENLIVNGDFADGAAGAGPPTWDFDSWDEDCGEDCGASDGDVEDIADAPYANVAKLTCGAEGEDWHNLDICYALSQHVGSLETGHPYRLTLHVKNGSAANGRYYVRKPNAPATWLLEATFNEANWATKTFDFNGPAGSEIILFLGPPASDTETALFADVQLLKYQDVVYPTSWFTIPESIDRHGRKEEILVLDSYPLGTANAACETVLADQGWPQPRGVSFGQGDATLRVTAVGYGQTMNWLFQAVGDGTSDSVDDWITEIVGTEFGLSSDHTSGGGVAGAGDCQFVKAGHIAANALYVTKETTVDSRAWDVLMDLLAPGIEVSGVQVPALLWVGVGRLVHYEPIDVNPLYYWRGYLSDASGAEVNPRLVRPGVVRDLTYQAGRLDPDSLWLDSRDVWVKEVEVGPNDELILKPAAFNRAEMIEEAAALQFAGEKEPMIGIPRFPPPRKPKDRPDIIKRPGI